MKQEADGTTNFRQVFAAGNPGALAEELHCFPPSRRKARRLQERPLLERNLSVVLPSPCLGATRRTLPLLESSEDAAPAERAKSYKS